MWERLQPRWEQKTIKGCSQAKATIRPVFTATLHCLSSCPGVPPGWPSGQKFLIGLEYLISHWFHCRTLRSVDLFLWSTLYTSNPRKIWCSGDLFISSFEPGFIYPHIYLVKNQNWINWNSNNIFCAHLFWFAVDRTFFNLVLLPNSC